MDAFLRKLRQRGLRGVKLVISDAHDGLKAAIAKLAALMDETEADVLAYIGSRMAH